MLVTQVAGIDAAHRAEDFARAAISARIPFAVVLKPDAGGIAAAFGAQLILDLEGDAVAIVLAAAA
ncbi:MAG: hypothetical protein ABL879_19040, partial [Devosia sp.]